MVVAEMRICYDHPISYSSLIVWVSAWDFEQAYVGVYTYKYLSSKATCIIIYDRRRRDSALLYPPGIRSVPEVL